MLRPCRHLMVTENGSYMEPAPTQHREMYAVALKKRCHRVLVNFVSVLDRIRMIRADQCSRREGASPLEVMQRQVEIVRAGRESADRDMCTFGAIIGYPRWALRSVN